MTTNITHILNQNLDQFPGFDFPADMVELEDGSIVTLDEACGWHEPDEDEPEDECTCFLPDGTPVSDSEFLAYLEQKLGEIAETEGRDSEEYRGLASFYSDVYKDINGFRPRGN